MPSNEAMWLPRKRAALELGLAPYPTPGGNEIVVRNRAVAINVIDRHVQAIGDVIFPWIRYPFILGSDSAGEVVEVGSAVTRFKVGDRVLGHAVGVDKTRNNPAESSFQTYTLLLEHMASPMPFGMTAEQAAVLPLAVSTAACGLFQKDFLALDYPSSNSAATGKVLVVWGGSTSVGSQAIQLGTAAGYQVITTASPRNFAYVKQLGATAAFDYRSRSAVRDIIAAIGNRKIAGAMAIGQDSAKACVDIVGACKGVKFVALASTPVSFDNAPSGGGRLAWLIPKLFGLVTANLALMARARRRGVKTKFIFGTSLIGNEVGPLIYADFLPGALASGRYKAAPEPLVVGKGLSAIQAGLDAQKKGVSARKIVVTL